MSYIRTGIVFMCYGIFMVYLGFNATTWQYWVEMLLAVGIYSTAVINHGK